MRKLASIQMIKSLEAIEGADAIEKATVLGWQLVVKKGDFMAGDLCVYCEIDSLMPERPEFEFLKLRGMRIKRYDCEDTYRKVFVFHFPSYQMESPRKRISIVQICWALRNMNRRFPLV